MSRSDAVRHTDEKGDAGEGQALEERIIKFGQDHGADLIGFAPAERWDEYNEVPPDFRPRAIWTPAQTVIVMGIQMPLPVVETTPSVLHMELYKTVNRELDALGVDLMRYLNRLGHPAFFFPRDGYSSLAALKEKPFAAFSHVMAAKYAGLGTIGLSHCLLTREYGPRVRFVSVFTDAVMPAGTVIVEDLCTKCGLCAKTCPKQALKARKDTVIGDYDKAACLEMSEELTKRGCYPCGTCTKVCPIGKDRALYKQENMGKKYRGEATILAANPDAPDYKAWQHVRKYGSRSSARTNADRTEKRT
ncbi:MAG: 4Fe-4S binding protein [Dehalococcoidales bacterium]|nr:4Fe-4S binding protein [Dehalococcoidales bacterium]